MFELKVVLALDLKVANGLDFISPGASSSKSFITDSSNSSSNVEITMRTRNQNEGIRSAQVIATVTSTSSSSLSPHAIINVSASLSRNFIT